MTIHTGTLRTRTLAVVTVTIAGLLLTGCSLLGNTAAGNTPTPTAGPDGTSTDVFTIKVGDCLNNGGATGEVSLVKVTECAAEHDSEAYESITMTDGDYPGGDAVAEKAVSACSSAFTAFIGIAYDSSSFDFSYYYPTEESWAQADREILCLVYSPDGKTTGSLAGAAK